VVLTAGGGAYKELKHALDLECWFVHLPPTANYCKIQLQTS